MLGKEISWSRVPAEDPDQAFVSLRNQGMVMEEIVTQAGSVDSAADDCPNRVRWPRAPVSHESRSAECIPHSLSATPIRIVVISDTHSLHSRMTLVWATPERFVSFLGMHRMCFICILCSFVFLQPLPAGDILVHCGDMTNTGKATEIQSFVKWFASHPHPHKVMIAGNHDVTLDENFYARKWNRFHSERCDHLIQEETSDGFVPPATTSRAIFYRKDSPIIALENSGACIRGLQFWGSPCSPEFCEWSHSVQRGGSAADLWQQIPSGTQVLLTHGPPIGYGDAVNERRTGDVSDVCVLACLCVCWVGRWVGGC